MAGNSDGHVNAIQRHFCDPYHKAFDVPHQYCLSSLSGTTGWGFFKVQIIDQLSELPPEHPLSKPVLEALEDEWLTRLKVRTPKRRSTNPYGFGAGFSSWKHNRRLQNSEE